MLIYIIAINIICFLIMCYDKAMARAHKYRVPEIRLLMLAAAGGSLGIYMGMHIFKHKTKKLIFVLGVPIILFIQIIIFRTLR
ncbi:MAG: DUF1294 domain-containing protein [Desulfotomaculaceae bacterium]|nr:DUF1294 domain-containing protein [Desulfotomaculaceae bacterium]